MYQIRNIAILTVAGTLFWTSARAHVHVNFTPENNGSPYCPLNRDQSTWPDDMWREWLANPEKYWKGSGVVSVRFDNWPNVGPQDTWGYSGETDPLGIIYPQTPYTVSWEDNRWISSGQVEHTEGHRNYNAHSNNNSIKGPPGRAHPDDYELMVHGHAFDYNEAGEVFHDEYGLVGHLHCRLGGQSF